MDRLLAPRRSLADRHPLTIESLINTAKGFRWLAGERRRRGNGAGAARCEEHAQRTDALVDDLERGSPGLLRRIAQDAATRRDWTRAMAFEEHAALAEHRAAIALDGAD